ncbi:MAG: LEA type 2 family protein [Bdellovibrionales bacterium]|nr:LEA type 2 family protein [Bdellovibrionales bacterium]
MIRSFVLLLVAFSISACAVLQMASFEKPKVKLHGIELQKIDFQNVDLVFEVEVQNPNDFKLSMKGLNYVVEMNGDKVATQDLNTPVEVGAQQSSIVKLPLKLDYAQIFGSIGGFLKAKESTYTIKGSAQFGVLSLPFSESGEIRIDKGELTHKKL